jgi:ABC-type lipoprotein release transport system permease subunit
MTSLLFEVSPLDSATYLTVSAVLAAAALLASYVPARKSTAIEPMEALRAE